MQHEHTKREGQKKKKYDIENGATFHHILHGVSRENDICMSMYFRVYKSFFI